MANKNNLQVLNYRCGFAKVSKGYTKVTLTSELRGSQIKNFIPHWPKYVGLRQFIQEELKSINKGHPAFLPILSRVFFHECGHP